MASVECLSAPEAQGPPRRIRRPPAAIPLRTPHPGGAHRGAVHRSSRHDRSRHPRRPRPQAQRPGAARPQGRPRRPRAELQGHPAGRAVPPRPGDARGVRSAARRPAANPREAGCPGAAAGRARGPRRPASRRRRPLSLPGSAMNLALAYSRARVGVHAPEVRVEAHLGGGLPNFTLVGMPATAVRESRERVRAAIINAQLEFPQRRITVNLAPADLPKEGGRYDLAIALGLLAASGQLPLTALSEVEVLGELALTGELKPVDGVLPAALAAARAGRLLIVPAGNGSEAALAGEGRALVARTLLEVCAHLQGRKPLPPAQAPEGLVAPTYPDLADVRGQATARRALEAAAAGGHALLFIGP